MFQNYVFLLIIFQIKIIILKLFIFKTYLYFNTIICLDNANFGKFQQDNHLQKFFMFIFLIKMKFSVHAKHTNMKYTFKKILKQYSEFKKNIFKMSGVLCLKRLLKKKKYLEF